MTINERIRHLRKDVLKLNQTDFAKAIGMKQTGLSYIEKDKATVKEQVAKTICMAFNLNEEWLRNGVEPMHVEPDTFSLDEFMKQRRATELEKQIVKTYFDLDPDTREMLVGHFRKGLLASAFAPEKKTVAELEEEYKKTVLNSASKKDASASPITSVKEKEARDA